MSRKRKSTFDNTLVAIGKRIKELRIAKGYRSTAEFAAAHKLAPIQYWRIENGRANLTLRSLNIILSIHGLTVADLFANGLAKATRARAPKKLSRAK